MATFQTAWGNIPALTTPASTTYHTKALTWPPAFTVLLHTPFHTHAASYKVIRSRKGRKVVCIGNRPRQALRGSPLNPSHISIQSDIKDATSQHFGHCGHFYKLCRRSVDDDQQIALGKHDIPANKHMDSKFEYEVRVGRTIGLIFFVVA